MTEAEWLRGTDPLAMLLSLRGRASDRKLRLLAAACCRRVWARLPDRRSRAAVELAEQLADGPVTPEHRKAVAAGADAVAAAPEVGRLAEGHAAQAAAYAAFGAHYPFVAARRILHEAAAAASPGAEAVAQAALLRDIFGNPFRPMSLNPRCLCWREATIPRLAREIYDRRQFAGLPVLADALEEAGCTDQDLPAHCRSGGEHVRGCWALDLVLGWS